MEITKRGQFTGQMNTMDIPVTQEQIDNWLASGKLIQEALPNLDSEQREFLMTGTTPEEWAAIFPPEEDEDG